MTAFTSVIKRQLPDRIKDRGRFVTAEISEAGVSFRRKGTQEVYEVPWGVLYDVARKFGAASNGITTPGRLKGRRRYRNA